LPSYLVADVLKVYVKGPGPKLEIFGSTVLHKLNLYRRFVLFSTAADIAEEFLALSATALKKV
jgi:hypothetical protein